MSVQLLDKTRKINKLLHNNHSHRVVFNDICDVLSEVLDSNVLVISKKGKILGLSFADAAHKIDEMITNQVGDVIDPLLNDRLLMVLSTNENVNFTTLGFSREVVVGIAGLLVPIMIAGERLGSAFANNCFASSGKSCTSFPPRRGSIMITGMPFFSAYSRPLLPACVCSSI